jgi:glycosyltransferase involved in cell wall biosynthesis
MVLPHAPFLKFDNRIRDFQEHLDVPVVKRILALKNFFKHIIFVSGSSHSFDKPVMFGNIEYYAIKGYGTLQSLLRIYDFKVLILFFSLVLRYGRKLKILNFSMASSSVVLCLLSMIAGTKFITYFTGVPEAASHYKRKILFDYKLLLILSSKVITNNPSVKKRLLKIYPREDIEVIPNFVEPTFKPLDVPKQTNWMLYVGRLDPEKRVSYLLQAFSLLRKRISNAKLYIIGDGPELQNLSLLSEKLGISESVHFLGWVPHEELPLWMNKCGVFVLPSVHEGFPNVLLEAMACGTPIVCMDAPYARSMLRNVALLVEPTSQKKLAEAIEHVILNNDLWKKLRENGIRRASNLKVEQFVKRITKVLE